MMLYTYGSWVRQRRLILNLTQAALAHRVGCAKVTIKKIEHDERRPSRCLTDSLQEGSWFESLISSGREKA